MSATSSLKVKGKTEWNRRQLGDDLERDVLEGLDPMPHRHRPAGVKDGGLQLLGAFGSQLGERASAFGRVCLVDEHERLAHR